MSFSVLHWSGQNMDFLYEKDCSVIEVLKSDEKLELSEKYCSMALLLWMIFFFNFLSQNKQTNKQKFLCDYSKSQKAKASSIT